MGGRMGALTQGNWWGECLILEIQLGSALRSKVIKHHLLLEAEGLLYDQQK